MKNRPWIFFAFLFTLLFSTTVLQATEITPESVKGIYHLGIPERGQQQVEIAYGDMKGKTVIAVAPCERCPPAVYSYLKRESRILDIPVFTTNGLYLFQYDNDSFVIVQPDSALGSKTWSKIDHANIYSKNIATAKSVSRDQIESFVTSLSKKVMGQDIGSMQHATGVYYLAMPVVHIGNAESQYNIELITSGEKEINIVPCSKCAVHRYQYLPKESAIADIAIYRYASGDYLFDIEGGVLVHVFANAEGLGKIEWGENSQYNVFSNNQAYIRHMVASAEKQTSIYKIIKGYFSAIKEAFDKRSKEAEQETQEAEVPTE